MKYLILTVVFFFAATIYAQEQPAPANEPKAAPAVEKPAVKKERDSVKKEPKLRHDDWDFFELTFFPGVPSDSMDSKVYGVKLGLPVSTGKGFVYGVETSPCACMTQNVKGTQLAPLFNDCANMTGLQASVVNVAKSAKGLQLGLVNVATERGFQIGGINYIKDGLIPVLPVINFSF